MTGSIFLLSGDDSLRSLEERSYISEDRLQSLLEQYPQLLAGEQVDSVRPRRWMLVSRELGVPAAEDGSSRWALDHLFLDQDGVPTLVEVKRSTDRRIRREVVGQMLDYAANGLVYWPPESIRQKYEARCDEDGTDPEQQLSDFIEDQTTYEEYWHRVKTNLQAGRVRLVFVADEIPSELKQVVEFLNGQMDPAEVLAVEIRQYAGEDVRTLVPRVIGMTAGAQRAKGTRSGGQWDKESFFPELERRTGAAEVKVARNLYEWGEGVSDYIWWGEGSRSGSFVPIVRHGDGKHQIFAVWTYGKVEIYFQYYAGKPPFDSEELRRELAARLEEVPGVRLPADAITRRPSIELSVLSDSERLDTFLEAFNWYLAQVRSS